MKRETNEYYTTIYADEGKTFKHKEDGEIIGRMIILSKIDSADNYIEVDIPAEPEDEKDEALKILGVEL